MSKKEIVEIHISSLKDNYDSLIQKTEDQLLVPDESIPHTTDPFTALFRLILNKKGKTVQDLKKACHRVHVSVNQGTSLFNNLRRLLINRDARITLNKFNQVLRIFNIKIKSISMTICEVDPTEGELKEETYELKIIKDLADED